MKKIFQYIKRKVLLVSIIMLTTCLVVPLNLNAQSTVCTHSITGEVLDKDDKTPLPYATVKVQGFDNYALTDIDGKFVIENVCDSNAVLVISCLGYCNTTCESHHKHGRSPHIYLTQEVNDLDGVTIQAERRKEQGTETIAQIQLKDDVISIDPTQSLASVIEDQQGVALTSTGSNVQRPVIHGLYGNRVLILNNGVKHGFQNWGNGHAPEIDISSAHELTIIKGAAGVRYGPEALGGVISIENAPLYLNESLEVEIVSGYQTNGRGYFLNGELTQGFENLSYYFGGKYTKIGDRHTPHYYLTNSGKEERGLNTGLRYRSNNLDVKMYYSYLDQNLALLRASIAHSGSSFTRAINNDEPIIIQRFSYEIGQPNQTISHHLGKAEVRWSYSDHGSLILRYGKQLNQRQEYDVRRNADIPIINMNLITDDLQLEWKHPHLFKLDGIIGFQLFTQLNDNLPGTFSTPFIPNYKSTRYSGFVVESLKKHKNTFEGGLRIDFETNYTAGREMNQEAFSDHFSFMNLTGSLGYVREFSKNSSFRTNLGTAWRTPNMAELYSFGQHGFKTSYGLLRYNFNENGQPRTNEVLKLTESNVQAEKGYKFINEVKIRQAKSIHTITAYSHYIQNYTYVRPLGVFGTIRGPMPAFIYEQVDAVFIGADYSWQRKFSRALSSTLGGSYLWSQNIENETALINQPPISFNWKIEYKTKDFWKIEKSKIALNSSYTMEQMQAPQTISPEELIHGTTTVNPQTSIFDFSDAPKAYFLMNVSWSFNWKQFGTSISVNNLLNTRYRNYLNELRYFADEPGRNILFTLKYNFKND